MFGRGDRHWRGTSSSWYVSTSVWRSRLCRSCSGTLFDLLTTHTVGETEHREDHQRALHSTLLRQGDPTICLERSPRELPREQCDQLHPCTWLAAPQGQGVLPSMIIPRATSLRPAREAAVREFVPALGQLWALRLPFWKGWPASRRDTQSSTGW